MAIKYRPTYRLMQSNYPFCINILIIRPWKNYLTFRLTIKNYYNIPYQVFSCDINFYI